MDSTYSSGVDGLLPLIEDPGKVNTGECGAAGVRVRALLTFIGLGYPNKTLIKAFSWYTFLFIVLFVINSVN